MKRTVRLTMAAMVLPSLGLLSAGLSAPLMAQAVVQPLPPAAAVERLNSNLARLSRAPQDVEALLGAGQAALDLGDVQAANGFFTRANTVNANLGRAKLGLAVVQLALKQPVDAAANFDAAEALGEPIGDKLADRAMAYDLTGQQAKALRDYQAALRADPKDTKAMTRYAVSLGIAGRLAEADKLLEPALAGGDREAWRFRAFIYAMNGRLGEARNITQSVMPKGLADALDPYMARVSLLTSAQKAAAAHYGDFPANVLRLAAPNPSAQPPVQVASRDTGPAETPRSESGNSSRTSRNRSTNASRPASEAGRTAAQIATAAAAPPPERPAPEPARQTLTPPPPPPEPVQVARAEPPPTRALSSSAPAVVRPTLSAPARAAPASSTAQSSLAAALSQLTVPEAEKVQTASVVDLQALAKSKADKAKAERDAKAKAEREAKAKAEAEEKKKLKANPSRIWVQIAAGRNVSALAFDMRRFRKSYADEIGDESGWYADWGQTNRLLIGPYRKEDQAKTVVTAIKKAGGDAFVWLSDAGEEVKKIGAQ